MKDKLDMGIGTVDYKKLKNDLSDEVKGCLIRIFNLLKEDNTYEGILIKNKIYDTIDCSAEERRGRTSYVIGLVICYINFLSHHYDW